MKQKTIKKSQRDIIIISEGGCMLGVFGAGVVSAFQDAKIYPRVHSVYGSSSGSHNLAYFLSHQVTMASWVYINELSEGKFVSMDKLWPAARKIMFGKSKDELINLVDMDLLEDIQTNRTVLDVKAVQKSEIDFYVRVFDVKTNKLKFIDGKKDTLRAMKASAAMAPFYTKTVNVGGREYIDGSVIVNRTFLDVIKNNPDKKILFILNDPKNFFKILKSLPFVFLESILLAKMHGFKMGFLDLISVFKHLTPRVLERYTNVTVIKNDLNYSISCDKRDKLILLRKSGYKKAKEALKRIL